MYHAGFFQAQDLAVELDSDRPFLYLYTLMNIAFV